jgi:Na+/H+ antiporter NhaD and related arsenite permeases
MFPHSDSLTLSLFLLVYSGIAIGHIASFKINRTGIALLGAILLVAFGQISPQRALLSVNFATLITLYGLMILSGHLWLSGFYTWVAEKISQSLDKPGHFLFMLVVAAGLLSAFLINDVVCLAFTPVVTLAVQRKGLNPVPFLVGMAIASNIGAAATPIGNAQNILVATEAGLHFPHYMLWCVPPVLLSLSLSYFLVLALGKKDLAKAVPEPKSSEQFPPLDKFQTVKGLIILGAAVALFFTPLPRALFMVSAGGVLLLSRKIYSDQLLSRVDYSVLTLFAALFVVVGAVKGTVYPELALSWLGQKGFDLHNPYLLSVVTALLSNLMSNAAAVMLLTKTLPVTDATTGYVLCVANSFAGNMLIVGSIANLIVVEQAESRGVKIGFWKFARYGMPASLASFAVLWGWIWIRSA